MGHRGQTRGTVSSVAILGCGRIGSALDEDPSTEGILSHAGAVSAHPEFELVALCDLNPERLAAASRARGVDACFEDPLELLRQVDVDVAVLCGPTHTRLATVEACMRAGVGSLVLEKPLASNLRDAETVAKLVADHQAISSVNFLRRFCPPLQDVAQRLRAGEFGAIQHITAHYGKGLNNNGSHVIDLLRWWVGDVIDVEVLDVVADDRGIDDPTLSLRLRLQSRDGEVSAYLLGSDHRQTSLFEVDILTTKNRFKLVERGGVIERFDVIDDPTFPGYTTLGLTARVPGEISVALAHMWADLAEVLKGDKAQAACTIRDALDTLRVVETSQQTYRSNTIPERERSG